MAQHSRSVMQAIEEGAAPVEEGDEETFMPVSKLSDEGINVTDINKLKEAGKCTIGTIRKPHISASFACPHLCAHLFISLAPLHTTAAPIAPRLLTAFHPPSLSC